MLRRYFGRRSDLGVWRFVGTKILQPQNPFEPPSPRKPQRWFVLLLIIALAFTGALLYFNSSE